MNFFRVAVLGLLFLLPPSLLSAQDDTRLDELFTNPPPDHSADTSQTVNIDIPPQKAVRLFGTLSSQGAMVTGIQRDSNYVASSVLALLHLQGGVDIRPDPTVRIYGTVSTVLPQGLDSKLASNLEQNNTLNNLKTTSQLSLNTSSVVSIDELFFDYTIKDWAFFRAGKFTLTWGQGRIFNPGNLTSGIEDGMTIKAFFPVLSNGITGLVIARPSYFPDLSHPDANEFGYAGLFETTLGPLNFGISAFRQLELGATGDVYLKGSLWGMDFFAEGLVFHQNNDQYLPSFVGGLAWEGGWDHWKIRLASEYWFNGFKGDWMDQNVGVAFTTDAIPFINLRPSCRWVHSLEDRSGQLVGGLESSPLPNLTISFGVPYTYGDAQGKYVLGSADPDNRWIAATLKVAVNVRF